MYVEKRSVGRYWYVHEDDGTPLLVFSSKSAATKWMRDMKLPTIDEVRGILPPQPPPVTDAMVDTAARAFIEVQHGPQPAQWRPGERLLQHMRAALEAVAAAGSDRAA